MLKRTKRIVTVDENISNSLPYHILSGEDHQDFKSLCNKIWLDPENTPPILRCPFQDFGRTQDIETYLLLQTVMRFQHLNLDLYPSAGRIYASDDPTTGYKRRIYVNDGPAVNNRVEQDYQVY